MEYFSHQSRSHTDDLNCNNQRLHSTLLSVFLLFILLFLLLLLLVLLVLHLHPLFLHFFLIGFHPRLKSRHGSHMVFWIVFFYFSLKLYTTSWSVVVKLNKWKTHTLYNYLPTHLFYKMDCHSLFGYITLLFFTSFFIFTTEYASTCPCIGVVSKQTAHYREFVINFIINLFGLACW
jgi:hypothetical protein